MAKAAKKSRAGAKGGKKAAAKKKAGGKKKPAMKKKPAARAARKTAKSTPKKAAKKPVATKKAPARKAASKPAAGRGAASKPGKGAKAARPGKAAEVAEAPAPRPARTRNRRRSSRRAMPPPRRGPDGELLAPGELLLPKGPQSEEEVHYLLRGCVAGEDEAGELGIAEVLEKQGEIPDKDARSAELRQQVEQLAERFKTPPIEPNLPVRSAAKYTFEGIVERAKLRRREIGAFLRGLDLARTESSHMDSHGEASLQNLMEWAARLEKLMDAEEPEQGDYAQFHRGMDQLDHTTESLIVDVEQTLKRLGKRSRRR